MVKEVRYRNFKADLCIHKGDIDTGVEDATLVTEGVGALEALLRMPEAGNLSAMSIDSKPITYGEFRNKILNQTRIYTSRAQYAADAAVLDLPITE
ncbi:MAG: hypothetical protein AABW73_05085 [Nanoarchaeota archaeon]